MLKSLLKTAHPSSPIIVAHRGFQPENMMEGFQKAVLSGAKMIECDVRMSKDGFPVVLHDKRIDRTTNGNGYVANMNKYELEKYNVPSFDSLSAFVANNDVCMAVEIKDLNQTMKNVEMLSKIILLLQNHDIVDRCVVISFNKHIIARVKEIEPRVSTGLVYGPLMLNDPIYLCKKHMADHLWLHHDLVSADIISSTKRENLELFAWTVNKKEDYDRILQLGVKYIVTDSQGIDI